MQVVLKDGEYCVVNDDLSCLLLIQCKASEEISMHSSINILIWEAVRAYNSDQYKRIGRYKIAKSIQTRSNFKILKVEYIFEENFPNNKKRS